MIAVITSSGAFLYDLSQKEADKGIKNQTFFDNELVKACRGWLLIDGSMAYSILNFGIIACYVDLNSMRSMPKIKPDYFKIGTLDFLNIWNRIYPIEERIKGGDIISN